VVCTTAARSPRRCRLASQKIIRCEVRRAGDAGPATERFVPLEIFGLWEHLMVTKHGFEVLQPRASLWLDMEDSPEAAYSTAEYEPVTEVTTFVYSGRDDLFTKTCRYFPTARCPELKAIFLGHHRDADRHQPSHVRERPGVWLHRSLEPSA
jgi:hypothetical protein